MRVMAQTESESLAADPPWVQRPPACFFHAASSWTHPRSLARRLRATKRTSTAATAPMLVGGGGGRQSRVTRSHPLVEERGGRSPPLGMLRRRQHNTCVTTTPVVVRAAHIPFQYWGPSPEAAPSRAVSSPLPAVLAPPCSTTTRTRRVAVCTRRQATSMSLIRCPAPTAPLSHPPGPPSHR